MSTINLFYLFQVEGSRLDSVTGSFRRASSESDVDRSDVIVNAIVELNEHHKGNKRDARHRKRPSGPGADALKDWFDDNSSSDDNNDGISGRDNSQYSAASFSVSLMDLANRLNMEPDRVASALYSLQKRGVISYTIAETMIYVTSSTSDISSSLRLFAKSPEFETYLEEFYKLNAKFLSKSGPISAIKVLLHCWMKHISHAVNKILIRVMTDASNRVLDMWRVGCVVSSTLNGGKVSDGSKEETSVLGTTENSENKRKVMDFLCHYMRHLSSHHEAHVSNTAQDSKPSDSTLISSSMIELENEFRSVEVPIMKCSLSFREIRSQILTKPGAEREDKWQGDFWNDVIRMIRHPQTIEFSKSITSHVSSSVQDSSSFSAYHRQLVRQRSSYYNFELIPLFVAKIFHGLGSNLVKQDDWVASGLWGRYRNVAFDNIVYVIKQQLHDESAET